MARSTSLFVGSAVAAATFGLYDRLPVPGLDSSVAVAATPLVTRGPYLQLSTPSSQVVRWRTDVATNSRVRYGTDPNGLVSSASDPLSTTEHVVTLTSLAANTRYYYRVGTSSMDLAGGGTYSFTTAPLPGSTNPLRIWVLGDSGTGNASAKAVRDAYDKFTGSRATHLWLMLGDNAYSSGSDGQYQYSVFSTYLAMLRTSTLWPALGNHDTAGSTSPPASLPYFRIFSLPTAGQAGGIPSGTPKYYSFDFGNVHFVCLDSFTSSRQPGSPMLKWLESDLSANTRDWLIAYWHHPPYSKGSHNSDAETPLIEMRTNVLPILEAQGVDLVLTGHSHSYERSFLLDGHYGLSSTLKPSMIKDGGSGRPAESGAYAKPLLGPQPNAGAAYVVLGNSGKLTSAPLNHPAMFTSQLKLGSLVLDVEGSRLDAKFLRETGVIADSFSIVKGAGTSKPADPAPQVTIFNPVNGAAFTAGATVAISATATDPSGISSVRFYRDATLLRNDTVAPYNCNWTNAPAGDYTLTAVATNSRGVETTSAPVSVRVVAGTP
ncbi:MAG: metallophosphoesterase [Bryobacteraceae bacterium]|nr:metallophosphoesterase [Bryobacteraceae bacterium]